MSSKQASSRNRYEALGSSEGGRHPAGGGGSDGPGAPAAGVGGALSEADLEDLDDLEPP